MSNLVDINVWLALTFSSHPHHRKALAWFDSVPSSSCSFCRMTQQGYLRLSTNSKIFRSDTLSLSQAWSAYDALLSDSRVRFDHEPSGVEAQWRLFTGRNSMSTKIWNDAYLAAFAKSSGATMVTFDKGFRQYPELSCLIIS